MAAWGYGIGFVSLIIIISNIGGLLTPVMSKTFFQRLLQFLVAMAAGTLVATGLLVLIPEVITDYIRIYTGVFKAKLLYPLHLFFRSIIYLFSLPTSQNFLSFSSTCKWCSCRMYFFSTCSFNMNTKCTWIIVYVLYFPVNSRCQYSSCQAFNLMSCPDIKHSYIWKSVTTLVSIYIFFMSERILKCFLRDREVLVSSSVVSYKHLIGKEDTFSVALSRFPRVHYNYG